jgi:hypothetical protein
VTFFDRQGPDGAVLLRAASFTAVAAALGASAGAFLAVTRGGGASRIALWSLGLGTASAAGSFALTFGAAGGAGGAMLAFLQPSGASCPPARQFSLQEALAAQGDVPGALASFEDLIRTAPAADVVVRLRAADLYVRSKSNPRRAAALYREAQRTASISDSDHVYATNRLITLCLGPLDDRGAAMGELRRLIDRHPGTDVATDAREALATLKRHAAADA